MTRMFLAVAPTAAEPPRYPRREKNRLCHRGMALRILVEQLRTWTQKNEEGSQVFFCLRGEGMIPIVPVTAAPPDAARMAGPGSLSL